MVQKNVARQFFLKMKSGGATNCSGGGVTDVKNVVIPVPFKQKKESSLFKAAQLDYGMQGMFTSHRPCCLRITGFPGICTYASGFLAACGVAKFLTVPLIGKESNHGR